MSKLKPLNQRFNSSNYILSKYWWIVIISGYCILFLTVRLNDITGLIINSDEARHLLRAQATLNGDIFIGLRDSLKQFYIWVVVVMLLYSNDAKEEVVHLNNFLFLIGSMGYSVQNKS